MENTYEGPCVAEQLSLRGDAPQEKAVQIFQVYHLNGSPHAHTVPSDSGQLGWKSGGQAHFHQG
jgi:hypothetical protein